VVLINPLKPDRERGIGGGGTYQVDGQVHQSLGVDSLYVESFVKHCRQGPRNLNFVIN
jgi:hypothetical protein